MHQMCIQMCRTAFQFPFKNSMARLKGLEPSTSCVTGRRSNQLSYNPIMEERTGFEPAELLHPSVFKTDAINQTLPPLRIKLARELGLEPRTTVLETVVLPLHHSHVDPIRGRDPHSTRAYPSRKEIGKNKIGMTGFEPATPWSQTKCSTKLSYIP